MSAVPPKAAEKRTLPDFAFVPIPVSCGAANSDLFYHVIRATGSVIGKVRPSAFAVFRLMANWIFTACWTGSSAGARS